MRKETFTIDGDIYAEGITNGVRWNGWECPYFEYEEAIKILQTQDTKDNTLENRCTYYEISADENHIIESSIDGISASDVIFFEGKKYYPIGRFCWVWSIAPKIEEEEEF